MKASYWRRSQGCPPSSSRASFSRLQLLLGPSAVHCSAGEFSHFAPIAPMHSTFDQCNVIYLSGVTYSTSPVQRILLLTSATYLTWPVQCILLDVLYKISTKICWFADFSSFILCAEMVWQWIRLPSQDNAPCWPTGHLDRVEIALNWIALHKFEKKQHL